MDESEGRVIPDQRGLGRCEFGLSLGEEIVNLLPHPFVQNLSLSRIPRAKGSNNFPLAKD